MPQQHDHPGRGTSPHLTLVDAASGMLADDEPTAVADPVWVDDDPAFDDELSPEEAALHVEHGA